MKPQLHQYYPWLSDYNKMIKTAKRIIKRQKAINKVKEK
jgi:hypothetical protein